MTYSRIAGIGSHLPDKVLTNKGMEAIVETSDEWIRERTGIIAVLDEQCAVASGSAAATACALTRSSRRSCAPS